MKKLGKSTLDELAKRMPVLTDKEQRSSIGGTFFYSPSGEFLGERGYGNEIRIIKKVYFDSIGCYEQADLSSYSSSLSSSTDETKQAVILQMGRELGINKIDFYSGGQSGYFDPNTGMININLTSSYINGGYYHELQLL